MAKSRIFNSKTTAFLPFIFIVVAAVWFVEQQQKPPEVSLSAPKMALNSLDVRAPNERQFTLSDLSGNTVSLSDFEGKGILLNFFATWCPSCREEMPSLEALYQAKKDEGFVVLGVAADEDKKLLLPLLEDSGVTFPVVLDPKKVAFSQYFVRNIPITYFLDRQGRIAGMFPGPADWSSAEAQVLIDQLLQEP